MSARTCVGRGQNSMEQTVEARVRHIISVTEELIVLAGEENRRLSAGRPADLQDIVRRKHRLIRELEGWLNQTRAYPDILREVPPALGERLSSLTRDLAAALAENTALLNKALAATRRRTDTIVRAIRDARTLPAGYTVGGRQRTGALHPVSVGAGVKA